MLLGRVNILIRLFGCQGNKNKSLDTKAISSLFFSLTFGKETVHKLMYLTRNNAENCYMVRIMRQGKMYQKNFSKKKHGGWGKAKAAAAEWRDEQLKVLPPKMMNAEGRMSSRNTSGVVGVTLSCATFEAQSGTREYWSWKSKWPGCKFAGGIGWSIKKYGQDDAFALAVLSRELRTVDRDVVIKKLKKLNGSKKLQGIYDMRELDLQ